jgi:hypothetical protein
MYRNNKYFSSNSISFSPVRMIRSGRQSIIAYVLFNPFRVDGIVLFCPWVSPHGYSYYTPSGLKLSTFNFQPSTFNLQLSTKGFQVLFIKLRTQLDIHALDPYNNPVTRNLHYHAFIIHQHPLFYSHF